MTDTSLLTGGVPVSPDRGASTEAAWNATSNPAAMVGGGARRGGPASADSLPSPAPSGGGRIIRDPFAGYLEEALAEFIPNSGFARIVRSVGRDGRGVIGPSSPSGSPSTAVRAMAVQSVYSAAKVDSGTERTGAEPLVSKKPAATCLAAPSLPARREPSEDVHGTTTGYTYWRCRCDLCREAMSIYHAERRLRRAGLIA